MPYTVKLQKPCINMDLCRSVSGEKISMEGMSVSLSPLSTALCPCVKLSHRIYMKKKKNLLL